MTEYRTVPVALPKITFQIANEFHRHVQLIERSDKTETGWNWTQEAVDFACIIGAAAPQPDNELAELEHALAMECAYECAVAFMPKPSINWVSSKPMPNWMRYLELRGLLERHPTDNNLVRVKG